MGVVLGLDIGGTKLAAGVVAADGRVHSFLLEPTPTGVDAVLERLFELGHRAIVEAGADATELEAVGIACGGPLDAARGVASPPHLPGWLDVPVAALAEQAYERPVVLENDATAAAAGEHRFGAGAGTRTMVYLTLSTGVGGGVVVDGRLLRGAAGNAGELGHVTVDWRGRPCRGCGRRGCLEAYASGTSIAERTRELIAERDGSATILPAEPTAADVVAAARAGDGLAQSVWDETIEALACGLTTIVNVFEPETVVLGGGVSQAAEELLAPLRERVRCEAMGSAGKTVRIVQSALGARAGVVGAAVVARG